MEEWLNRLNKLYKMLKKLHFIHVIQFILVVLGVLAILYILALHVDDDKGRKINKEGFISSPRFPDVHHSLLLDSIYERKGPEILSYEDQEKKVPKSHVQSYKQYTNNRQSKSPCGGKDFRPNMCPYGIEKSPIKKPEMCIPAIQEGRIGWFVAKN